MLFFLKRNMNNRIQVIAMESGIFPVTCTKKYRIASGIITTVKSGVLAIITINVAKEVKNVPRNIKMVDGITSSIT